MDFIIGVWQVVFFFLFNCKLCECYGIRCAGKVIVKSNIIHLGTNLTVRCQLDTERYRQHFAIAFNGKTIFEKKNSFFVQTEIVVNQSKSWVLCMVKQNENWHIVCGQDLTAGYPPLKPTKFNCVTHRHSAYVNCSMAVTTETHLSTIYTVTFEHEWTSQSLQYEMKNGHVSIPRSVFNETLTYEAHVKGHNELGEANSTFTFSVLNCVIPITPEITKVEFNNGSFSPTIRWESSDDSLKPRLRFRSVDNNQDWVLGKVTELQGGLILMQERLEPFMSYVLELRVCVNSTNCSMWSQPFNINTPGIAPSHKLDVWRIINKKDSHGLQDVTVLWKPYKSENYTGNLLQYKLSYEEKEKVHEMNCSTDVTRHTLQLPLEVAEINVNAITSAGSSPTALVSLTYTGKPAPIVTYLAPAPGGSVRLDWDVTHYREGVERIMGYVVQWHKSPVHLQWKRLTGNSSYTYLEGMQAGVLYNISLYIEEASGVSDPAFGQVYLKEEKPLTGPDVSITPVEEKHVLLQWEELEQEKRRGFITNYTIYIWRHTDKRLIQNITLPYTLPRSQKWKLLDPQESFDVLVSAWNSAGEGPKGKAATCYSDRSLTCGKTVSGYITDKMVAGICLVAAVPIVILANLMYLKCVRQRMMKMCMSMGVTWLFENLPKFDNSNAIKLLKDESYHPWEPFPGDSDPPLTPIEEVTQSWERQDSYPTVLHEDVPEISVERQNCIECPYKPQRTEGVYETTEQEVKEEEDQFQSLMSPLHLHYDFSWDISSFPVIPGPLNSILPMDGSLGSLSVLESFLSTPQSNENDGGIKENKRNVETRNVEQRSFISQTVLPNDLESCLLISSPYSPQGGCFHFLQEED
ncbi:interleukin-23 receptor isoform X1 [Triplophysa dalaica]|uniref:interleukin-23 receptor isoform X1 n=2 Tax=Triplophysa dalaica TaxID=1582913 RepID=UPI0024DFCF73|nr:interleukin-23 receptor isoform X1 [Triplophysa dalaica]XP_056605695.1 interleukin-23 receptor isoform X1 [Triplophysa dalaica]XP_056605696.1 interleukin-23 receptor isoform X1 [Triplophysa dalaica]XP_056605697.1 interleukin-23 receptor isoform X1 [Triplophysa dalaica]XP_056605698.1 interleukin-23 receptor isoform X1 [Triplophysa dalaica]